MRPRPDNGIRTAVEPRPTGTRPTGADHRREALELLRAQLEAGRDVHTVEIRHAA